MSFKSHITTLLIAQNVAKALFNKRFISLLVYSKTIRLFKLSFKKYFTYYIASKVGLTLSSDLELLKKPRLNYDGLQPEIRAGIIYEHECNIKECKKRVYIHLCTLSLCFRSNKERKTQYVQWSQGIPLLKLAGMSLSGVVVWSGTRNSKLWFKLSHFFRILGLIHV